jgi:hypothetical protein
MSSARDIHKRWGERFNEKSSRHVAEAETLIGAGKPD